MPEQWLPLFFGTGIITLPPYLMVPFLIVMGALAGGLLLIVPVLLKTRLKGGRGCHNPFAQLHCIAACELPDRGTLERSVFPGWPQAAPIIDEGLLPPLLAKGRLHAGLILALLMALVMWVIIRFTVQGYENPRSWKQCQGSRVFRNKCKPDGYYYRHDFGRTGGNGGRE